MRKRGRDEVPARLARAETRLAAWRKGRAKGERIPASLWRLAARLAADYGVSQTASVLKLDYYSLKKRLDHRAGDPVSPPSAFVELPAARPVPGNECVIEFADARGASMRVHWKGAEMPDLLALGRGFWSAE